MLMCVCVAGSLLWRTFLEISFCVTDCGDPVGGCGTLCL